jgi:O-antigen ligase
VIALQLLTSLTATPALTAYSLLLGTGLTSFFVLALLVINTQKRLTITLYTLIASGCFQAIYGSWMTLSGSEYLFLIPKDAYLGTATGTYINRNHLAGYLVICLSLGIGLMLSNLNQTPANSLKELTRRTLSAILSKKIIIRVALVIMVIGLVLTHSRMGNSSFFIALTASSFVYLITQRFSKQALTLFISLLVIDLFIVGAFFGVDKVVDRLNETTIQNESRVDVNVYNLEATKDNLWLGSGAGSFETVFTRYRGEDIRAFYDHAHNDYLEFIIERGLIGTFPMFLLVILSFFTAILTLIRRKSLLMKGTAFGCLMSIIALAIHSTVDFNLFIPANAASFVLVLALTWISLHLPTRTKGRRV